MYQLAFNFGETAYPGLDTLLGRANAELVHTLQQQHDRFIYLWGGQGSGKSHILQAWTGQMLNGGCKAAYWDAAQKFPDIDGGQADFIAVNRADTLDDAGQSTLFNVFNRLKNSPNGRLLLSSEVPVHMLLLRTDLRTRMAQCTAYEVKPPSDEEKLYALQQIAQTRRLRIDPAVYPYLLNHWQRDMDSLIRIFNDLEKYAITKRCPLTLALVRRLLKQESI